MVHGPNQRATRKAFPRDVPEPMLVVPGSEFAGPNSDVLRLSQQTLALRRSRGRETPTRFRLQKPGRVQPERRSRTDEPRIVQRRHRSHMSHHPGDIATERLHIARRHRYTNIVVYKF